MRVTGNRQMGGDSMNSGRAKPTYRERVDSGDAFQVQYLPKLSWFRLRDLTVTSKTRPARFAPEKQKQARTGKVRVRKKSLMPEQQNGKFAFETYANYILEENTSYKAT